MAGNRAQYIQQIGTFLRTMDDADVEYIYALAERLNSGRLNQQGGDAFTADAGGGFGGGDQFGTVSTEFVAGDDGFGGGGAEDFGTADGGFETVADEWGGGGGEGSGFDDANAGFGAAADDGFGGGGGDGFGAAGGDFGGGFGPTPTPKVSPKQPAGGFGGGGFGQAKTPIMGKSPPAFGKQQPQGFGKVMPGPKGPRRF
jgi:hypothetical protein